MTTAADDRTVGEAFEASLAGRPVHGEAAGLAAFTSAVRGTATQPGRPNAALADLLSTGLLTDQSSPSARTAPAAGSLPSSRTRSRTRRRFTVIVPALIAKFLSAGAVAQAATGAGVVVVVVTGAGAAGAQPEAAQQSFSDLTGIQETVQEPVEDVTQPVVAPGEGDGESADPAAPLITTGESDGSGEGETDAEPTDADLADAKAAAAWAAGPKDTSHEAFKAWLAEGSEKGWVNGQAVSEAVHARNEARKAARETEREAEDIETPDAPGVEDQDEDEDETEVASSDDDGDRSTKGSGKGSGKGKGRGGKD
jgi:hypothetical protein